MPRPRRVQVTQDLVMPDRSDPERHADLSSLFAAPGVQAMNIAIAAIQPNPYQPRTEFNPQQLEELANGIKAHGFLGTLLARHDPAGGDVYQLAYGERRWRASQMAGLLSLPVIVRDLSDQEMLEIAITENVLRADLNPLEEAEGYQQMMRLFGYSERKLATRIGKTRSYIQHRLRILRASQDVQQLVRERPDTLRYIAPLMAIKQPAIRAQLVEEIRQGRLVSDDIEERANQLGAQGTSAAESEGQGGLQSNGPRLRRDRLSVATRALNSLLDSRRLPMDHETLDRMRYLHELTGNYLTMCEARSRLEAHEGGSRVSH